MTFSERAVEAAARAMMQRRRDTIEGRAEHATYTELAKAALTAALAVDGLALVPKKPTAAMMEAGAAWTEYQPEDDDGLAPNADMHCAKRVWGAMLTAASDGEVGHSPSSGSEG